MNRIDKEDRSPTPPRHVRSGRLCVASLLVGAFAMVGCSDGRPERVPVSGTLTIDGQPLAGAFVNFYPASGRPSNGRTDESGRFVLGCFEDDDGAQVSTHEVSVIAVEEIAPNTMKWYAPKKYSRVDTADLSYTIDQPVDDLSIDLTWDGGKPFVERYAGGD
ncbi:hypothetical protein [Aeoliella sp.]|uniref:hypothetical protein n=1 Tax=Aeoliella sp. TaxID=2795800 RepID=UPI003CCC4369